MPVAAGLEADAVHGGVDLARAAQDLLELLAQVVVGGQVDRLAAEAGRLGQAVLLHVADDDHGRAQQVGRGGAGQPDRAGPGDVDGGAGGHPGGEGAVVAGREDVRQHGQVTDLGHGLVPVGELEQVPVGVGHGHVLGLAAQPAAHVDIAVGGAGLAGLTFSQTPVLRSLQLRQRPQAMLNGTLTRSPTLMNSTSRPTSATSPVISWPRVWPSGAVVRPRTMCWSEPQMLVATTFRITPCCSCRLLCSGSSSLG